MKAGAAKATLLLTLLSVGASVVLTWLCLAALGATDIPLQMWLVAAVVAPLTVVPIVFGAIVSLVYQLAAAKAELAVAASTDPLTGVANRRHFMEHGRQLLADTTARAPSLMLLDIDHFKTINDRFGHGLGDAVLVEVARRCTTILGPEHLFARLGGEEFAVLVTGTGDPEVIAERLREEISRLDLDGTGVPLGVTVSIGVAGIGSDRGDARRCRPPPLCRQGCRPEPSGERSRRLTGREKAATRVARRPDRLRGSDQARKGYAAASTSSMVLGSS